MMVQQRYNTTLTLALLAATLSLSEAFVPKPTQHARTATAVNGIFDKFGEFMEELDAFVDDATSRRLGNGSKFYGKRKSNFYGDKDSGKKGDKKVADPTGESSVVRTTTRWSILVGRKKFQGELSDFFISHFCFWFVHV
jgi:hypothetical protein